MKSIPTMFLVRCVEYACAAAAIAAITFLELNSAGSHHHPSGVLIVGLAVVAGATGPLDGLAHSWGQFMGPHAKQYDVEEPVKGLFLGLCTEADLDVTDFGLTVFIVRRSTRAFLRPIQERIFRLRLESNPRPTDVLWTKKKGVLGQCWQSLRPASLDHGAHAQKVSDVTNGRQWRRLPDNLRIGMRWKDFLQVRGFQWVEAHPIIDAHGRYRGCLVIQAKKEHKASLSQDRTRRLIERTCATVAAVLNR